MREHLTEMSGLPLVIDLRDVTCTQCGDQERQKTVVLDGEAVCVDRALCQGHGSVATGPVSGKQARQPLTPKRR